MARKTIDWSRKQHESGLRYEVRDMDTYAGDGAGTVLCDICRPNEVEGVWVSVLFDVVWDSDSIEFDWEPDGPATYVPYGEQSVLYDSGEGGLESVDASNAVDCEDYKFVDSDDEEVELSREQVIEVLGCTEEELDDIIARLTELVIHNVAVNLEEWYEDNPPEKPEYEPDYDDWRDVDWD